ncbi:MAG: ribonuclease D [Polyangiaceae bacterium]
MHDGTAKGGSKASDVRFVDTDDGADTMVRELANADEVAADFEADGLFAYRAKLCLAQFAHAGVVWVVDTLAIDPKRLAPLTGPSGPIKIIHDVTFDARLLTEAGLPLGNVKDTALAARMLGRTATGLASLVLAEFGVTLSKELQHHDWRVRPITARQMGYLAADVVHLAPLAERLFGEATAAGILEEVACETDHRIHESRSSAEEGETRPPYVRVKGIEKVPPVERAIVRGLAEIRETLACEHDVPPHRVLSAETLLQIARNRPGSPSLLSRIRGFGPNDLATDLVDSVLEAVREGLAAGDVPADERHHFERKRMDGALVRERKARESALTTWRKSAASERKVDPQVILPGHCLKEVVDRNPTSLDSLAEVAGIGAFRVARYGAAILGVLAKAREGEPAPDGTPP